MTNVVLKKLDLILAFLVGEISAWLMVLIGKNLSAENPSIFVLLPYFKYLPIIFPILCLMGLLAAYFLGRIAPVIYQAAKFVLLGGLNFLIDMGVLNFLVFATGISTGITQSLFKAISFVLAVLNSYAGNKYWVFKKRTEEGILKEFFQFLLISIIGFLINIIIDYVFVNSIGPIGGIALKTWAQISATIAAIIGMLWNFFGYKFIVFDIKK